MTKDSALDLIFEPGRLIAANAGILLSRVIYVKDGEAKHFLIIDAGMNDLIRPALYDAHHDIVSVDETPRARRRGLRCCGPVCETTDLFARDARLAGLKIGRSGGDHDGGRLWRGHVFGLQCAAAGARSAGEGRQMEHRAAANEL